MTDIDDLIREVEQSMEWFCDKIVEPVPHSKQDKEKIFERMVQLGWIRQSEVDIYKEMTKND